MRQYGGMMGIYQVFLPVLENSSEIAGAITNSQFLGSWQQDQGVMLYWNGQPAEFIECIREAVQSIGMTMSESHLEAVPVEMEDWNALWASSVQPIRVGKHVCIRPSWDRMGKECSGDIDLILDPKQAFGTGHHPTTQLLIAWLEELEWHTGMKVLDLGTGSGILAMVALRLGAGYALGIDNDSIAVECARGYARDNEFDGELEFWCGQIDDCPPRSFDVILANIDRMTLIQIAPEVVNFGRLNTQLFLSGLLLEDVPEVIDAFAKSGWAYVATRTREEWGALCFTRTRDPHPPLQVEIQET